jgi:hypothetical protein
VNTPELIKELRGRQRAAWNQYLEDRDDATRVLHNAIENCADELQRLVDATPGYPYESQPEPFLLNLEWINHLNHEPHPFNAYIKKEPEPGWAAAHVFSAARVEAGGQSANVAGWQLEWRDGKTVAVMRVVPQ